MKTMIFTVGMMSLAAVPAPVPMNSSNWYTLGAFIAFVLLAYLMYSLIKPENF
ncbi:MAG: potassium-transporting ATPase subunit F [Prolixibacteraceae bacterium]|nr:potassium-transporting ATPase subunit F [Prolixibacteraceae bacterium]